MQKRILFVDDEPPVLQGLRRMLHTMRHEWLMTFADSGQAALELLAHERFDIIVTDMRMPGMDGAQLLAQVQQRYPHMVRIILSGYADRELILKSVGLAHQYLAKPCDTAKLKNTIARVGALRALLNNETLRQRIAGMQTLPSLPSLYFEVVEAIQAPQGSLARVGEIIARDIGMTAKILQLANSAFFGLPRHISSTMQAVSLLGLDIVKALILSGQMFARFDHLQTLPLALDPLWQHSMAVSICAKRIAQLEDCERQVLDNVFMAGLLHDTGKLVLAANYPQEYLQVQTLAQDAGLEMWEAERAVLGASHAEVGGYLLDLWGLPSAIVESLAFHHCPTAHPHHTFIALTAIHVADAIVHETEAVSADGSTVAIDHDYLAQLGLSHRLAVWREQCLTVLQEAHPLRQPRHDEPRRLSV